MTIYQVQIIRAEDGTVTKAMETSSKKMAERLEDGVNINLNHEEYYTQIVEVEEKE
jgi:hypothetical protein